MDSFKKNKYGFRIWMVFLIFLFGKNGIAQTSITGKILNEATKIGLAKAEVFVYKNGNLIQIGRTDAKGNYKLKTDPGTYELDFLCKGFSSQKIIEVIVIEGQETELNLELSKIHVCDFIVQMRIPLVRSEKMKKGQIFVKKTFIGKPNREISETILMTPGVTLIQ